MTPGSAPLRVLALLLVLPLLAWPVPHPASAQDTLEDVVARAFDVSVTIAPVDLRLEFVGNDLRFLSHGTLRGRARITLDQWLAQVVLPDYVVARATSTRTDAGEFRTTATIRNTGTGAMPVDVAFGAGEGRVVRRVEVPSRGEAEVAVTTPAAVRQVEVDPHKWLIQSNYKNDTFEIR